MNGIREFLKLLDQQAERAGSGLCIVCGGTHPTEVLDVGMAHSDCLGPVDPQGFDDGDPGPADHYPPNDVDSTYGGGIM